MLRNGLLKTDLNKNVKYYKCIQIMNAEVVLG